MITRHVNTNSVEYWYSVEKKMICQVLLEVFDYKFTSEFNGKIIINLISSEYVLRTLNTAHMYD